MNYDKLKQIYEKRGTNYRSPEKLIDQFLAMVMPPDPQNVLDLGCGDGRIIRDIKAPRKTGVDFCGSRIKHARTKDDYTTYLCLSVEDFIQAPARFDIVLMFEILEHLIDDLYVFERIPKLCPDGKLIASVPLNMPEEETHLRTFTSIDEIVSRYGYGLYLPIPEKRHVLFCKDIKEGRYETPA